jgi:hypothetical protein
MEMERASWVWLMYLHDVLKQGVSRINRAVWLSLLSFHANLLQPSRSRNSFL